MEQQEMNEEFEIWHCFLSQRWFSIKQLCILNSDLPVECCLGGFPGGVGDATTISNVVDNLMMEKLKHLMHSKVDQPSVT